MLFGDYFGGSIVDRTAARRRSPTMREEWHGAGAFVQHGLTTLPFWLALAGIATAWFLYLRRRDLPAKIRDRSGALYALLTEQVLLRPRSTTGSSPAAFARLGAFFCDVGDRSIIDGFFVNGRARVVGATSALMRQIQSGYIYHYAFTMIIGVVRVACSGGVTLRAN